MKAIVAVLVFLVAAQAPPPVPAKVSMQDFKRLAAAQKILIDQAAVAFMVQTNEYDMWKPYVQGLTITPIDDQYLPGDSYFHNAYITQH